MTLAMAWVRTIPAPSAVGASSSGDAPSPTDREAVRDESQLDRPRRELLIASDSRLRAGYAWDAAPKVLRLPRGDSVIAFAGQTAFAYPLMIQAWNAVDSWRPSRERLQPLAVLKGHLIRVFNGMLDEISDLPGLRSESIPRPCCCWQASVGTSSDSESGFFTMTKESSGLRSGPRRRGEAEPTATRFWQQ